MPNAQAVFRTNVKRALPRCSSMVVRVCVPAALPEDSYEQTKVLAPLFNTLVDKISRDGPWLKEVLKDVLVSCEKRIPRAVALPRNTRVARGTPAPRLNTTQRCFESVAHVVKD